MLMEVQVLNIWDGKDVQTRKVAELSFRFPEIDIPFGGLEPFRNLMFLEVLERELQPLADVRFGKGTTIVEGAEIKEGSVEILLWLLAAGSAVYTFFKDYESLRKGVILFSKDLHGASSKIEELIGTHYLKKRKPRSSWADDEGQQGRTREKGK